MLRNVQITIVNQFYIGHEYCDNDGHFQIQSEQKLALFFSFTTLETFRPILNILTCLVVNGRSNGQRHKTHQGPNPGYRVIP